MHRCPFCHLPLDDKPPQRCPRCARSLIGVEPVANAALAVSNRARDRRLNRVVFLVGASLLSLIPCLLFPAEWDRWGLGAIAGALSGAVMWWKVHGPYGGMLVFALPQILLSGINFFAWVGYIAIGMALGH